MLAEVHTVFIVAFGIVRELLYSFKVIADNRHQHFLKQFTIVIVNEPITEGLFECGNQKFQALVDYLLQRIFLDFCVHLIFYIAARYPVFSVCERKQTSDNSRCHLDDFSVHNSFLQQRFLDFEFSEIDDDHCVRLQYK